MNRLWSRFGVRTLSIALLSLGVAGGYYVNVDRETQQDAIRAEVASNNEQAELAFMHQRHGAHILATVQKRAAEQEAARKAAEAARAEAERVKKAAQAAAERKKREAAAAAAEAAESKPFAGPIPASCNEYDGNREIGCALLLDRGFELDQMACLDKLWTKESGWNHKARNPSSGAYGIPQSLPGSKMGSVADDWETNPATQIKWGLGYIEGRYDTPCGAWAKSQEDGWY